MILFFSRVLGKMFSILKIKKKTINKIDNMNGGRDEIKKKKIFAKS